MNKKISIVVPVYKVPYELLEQCIKSLINQTYKNIEIILVDDGSPDDCPKICDKFSKLDDRIIVIHQKNKGLAGARNAGQKKATGEYITFVDGDDFIDEDSIERLYVYTKEKKYDIIRGMFYKEYKDRRVKCPCSNLKTNYEYTKNEIIVLKENVLNFNANISSVCGCLYKSSMLKKYGIYNDEQLKQGSEDVEFSFRVLDYIENAIIVEEYFYHYIYNDNSISTLTRDENNYMVLNCFKKILNNIEEQKDETKKKKMVDLFGIRIQYVVVTSMISGYFNPAYRLEYNERKSLAKKYLNHNLIKQFFIFKYINKMDIKRRIILLIIRFKLFFALNILGRMRYKEKHN